MAARVGKSNTYLVRTAADEVLKAWKPIFQKQEDNSTLIQEIKARRKS